MTVRRLILKEIGYRRGAFLLGLLSVAMAMTAWMGAVALLRANDMMTGKLLERRERATREEMTRMEDDYRLTMRELGYNVMIMPEGQDPAELRVRGHPGGSMPYEHVERLAHGRIETLNHLLPVLQKRVRWPEQDLEIILSGTPGQVPVTHKTRFLTPDGLAYHNPIMETIPPGELVLGHDAAQAAGLRAGDEAVLMGDEFTVRGVNPREGTPDDIAVWCHLDWAQERIGMENRINLILALECVCEPDSLGRITSEVRGLIQGVQVMEFSTRARVRAEARKRAEQAHRTAVESERRHREEMTDSHRRFAGVLAPLVVAGSVVWMVFLFLGNARERKVEISILRAIGVREHSIIAAFLVKSLVMGFAGGIVGFAAGHAVGAWWAGMNMFSREFIRLMELRMLGAALVAAPALCALAAWFPALRASRTDPARILCDA